MECTYKQIMSNDHDPLSLSGSSSEKS